MLVYVNVYVDVIYAVPWLVAVLKCVNEPEGVVDPVCWGVPGTKQCQATRKRFKFKRPMP